MACLYVNGPNVLNFRTRTYVMVLHKALKGFFMLVINVFFRMFFKEPFMKELPYGGSEELCCECMDIGYECKIVLITGAHWKVRPIIKLTSLSQHVFFVIFSSCRFFDTSKQAIGAMFIHFANIFLSTLTKADACSL